MSDDKDNVVDFDGQIQLNADIDIPIEKVLEGAKNASLKTLLIIGEEEDGSLYFASSLGKLADIYWMLALVQKEVLDFE
jgi:hypothetical protein